MADRLPVEVVSYIMQFLSVSDLKEACLVSRVWYEAFLDPVIQKKMIINFSSTGASSDEPLFTLAKRRSPHLVLHELDDSKRSKDLILKTCNYLSKNLKSLSLRGCVISESTLFSFLSYCHSLKSLDLSACDSVFMSGKFLESDLQLRSLQGLLGNVTVLNLSRNRYLSDAMFNRLVTVCSNVECLHLAANQITVNSSPYYPENGPTKVASSSVFTFENILHFLHEQQTKLKILDFSRTAINDDVLIEMSKLKGMQLTEIDLHSCRDVGHDGVAHLCEKQKSLIKLNLSFCEEICDATVHVIQEKLSRLEHLNLHKCFNVTDRSVKAFHKMQSLQYLDLSSCYNLTSKPLVQGLCSKPLQSLTHLNLNCCSTIGDVFVLKVCEFLPLLIHLDLRSCFSVTDLSVNAISSSLKHLSFLRLAWCKEITDLGLLGLPTEKQDEPHHHDNAKGECRCTRKNKPSMIFDNTNLLPRLEPTVKKLTIGDAKSKLEEDTKISSLNNLASLKFLDLSSCPKLTDAGIVHAMKFRELQHLNLSFCPDITDASLIAITKNNPSLETLILSQCNYLTDNGVVTASRGLRRLTHLELAGCDSVTDKSLRALATYSHKLRSLDVSHCAGIGKAGLEIVEKSLKNLQELKRAYTATE